MKTKIPVRDAMVTRVITIGTDKTVADAAKLMIKHDIGGVIVIENKEPVGIVTERDFVDLIAKDAKPSDITTKKAMSTPLVTISPNDSIMDAAKLMTKSKTRKLPVKDNGKLIGIITAEDIVKIAPREIELLLELASMKVQPEEFLQKPTEGECEICGNYSDYLHNVGDSYVCGDCKDSATAEEEE